MDKEVSYVREFLKENGDIVSSPLLLLALILLLTSGILLYHTFSHTAMDSNVKEVIETLFGGSTLQNIGSYVKDWRNKGGPNP